jgi:pyruvate,water dikinase
MADKIWVCDDEASKRFPVYTRGNVGEVFTLAVSPLTWSAYGPHAWEAGWRDAFVEMGVFTPDEFRAAGTCEIVGCFGGYVYINMSVTRVLAVRIPGLTIEAIDRSLFGDYPDVPPYRPDPRDANPERSAQVTSWLQGLFGGDPRLDTGQDGLRLEVLRAQRPALAALTEVQLLQRFRSLRPEGRLQFRRHVLNSYGANVLSSVIAQTCAAIGAGELAAKITTAVGDVESASQSFESWDLSRLIRTTPALDAAFDAGVDGLLERLRADRDARVQRFVADFERFIERWGFVAPSVWEFRSQTYATHPEILLRMLERARRAPDAAAPLAKAQALITDREAAIAQIAAALAGAPAQQAQFVGAARAAARYLAAREASKMNCARLIEEGRAAMRELGRRLSRRGLLRRWEDVLLVTDEEADAFVADPAAHAGLIAERAARLAMLEGKEPPFVFEGAPPPLSAYRDRVQGPLEAAAAGVQLAGIGVSPGRYAGRARVITSLDAVSDLEPGEIIVAVITDASWGPLFLAAGAVVVETGAPISHAAIVARELGIPAVVSVTGATRRIPDGAHITVDGNAGTVTLD